MTKVIKKIHDFLRPTKLSKWMDTSNGHSGGWFHRVKHGHDFVANVGKVYKKFRVKGVLSYPLELLKDSATPHGIPLPGTQFLVKSGLISPKTATDWLSMNLAGMCTVVLAGCFTYRLYKKSRKGKLNRSSVVWSSIGAVVKIFTGVVIKNLVLILIGVIDIAILSFNYAQAQKTFKKFLNHVFSDKAVAGYLGFAAGLGSAVVIKSAVRVFGTTSTGIALSTLAGGSVLLGLAAGYGIYRLLKKRKSKVSKKKKYSKLNQLWKSF